MGESTSQVVISGMAWSTCLGNDDEAWAALVAGRSGLARHTLQPRAGEPATVLLGLHRASTSPDLVAWAVTVARRALSDAGMGSDSQVPKGMAVVLATSLGAFDPDHDQPPEQWGAAVSAELGVGGPTLLVSTACASGTDAVAVGRDLLLSGTVRQALVVAADVVTPSKVQGQLATGLLSRTARLRPFHHGRDGTAVSDGAAAVVLELTEDAIARGGRIRGVVAGSASGLDATSFTAGDSSGAVVAEVLRRSLAAAGTSPFEVDVLSAHATSTELNDVTEARAYGDVFAGLRGPVVLATKPALGHSLGSTGLIELVIVAHALERLDLPPVLGVDEPPAPLPELGLRLAGPGARLPDHARIGVTLSTGIGGAVSAVVLRSAEAVRSSPPAGSVPPGASVVAEVVRHDVDMSAVPRLLPRTYADPVAWLLADVAREALTRATEDGGAVDPGRLGCIVVSDVATARTRTAVLASAREGFISPARFAGTSPSTLAAALCLVCEVRGQSVTLLGAPGPGLGSALDLASVWLAEKRADRVVVCVHHTGTGGDHVRGVVLHDSTRHNARLRSLG